MSQHKTDGVVIVCLVLAMVFISVVLVNNIQAEKRALISTAKAAVKTQPVGITHPAIADSDKYYKITCINLVTDKVILAAWSNSDVYLDEHEDTFSYFDVTENDRIKRMINGINCSIRPPVNFVAEGRG